MPYDKPKVTIDLEEYQHLKDRIAGMDRDEYVLAAKKVVAAMINTKLNVSQVHEYLSKEGIIFSVALNPHKSTAYGVHFDQISISLIDKKQ